VIGAPLPRGSAIVYVSKEINQMAKTVKMMAGLQTKKEFTGDMGKLIIGGFCCLPYGVYYYFDARETLEQCPECMETVSQGASTCGHCGEDLNQYR
jgi:hypothetical protein